MGTLTKIGMVMLVLALLATGVSAQSSRMAVVSVDSVTVQVGQEFTVPVWISGVSNLYGADVKLVFDNTVLQGVRVERGTLLTPGFVVRQGFYGPPFCTGPCARYAMTQIWPTPPVTGSGVFMIVRFKALQPGVSGMVLNAELSDPNGVLMNMNVRSGTVNVVAVDKDR